MFDFAKTSRLMLVAVVAILLLFATGATAVGSPEPQFRVTFHFGTVGINAEFLDSQTGERIENARIRFEAIPKYPRSARRIQSIRVFAPGYYPKTISSWSRFSWRMGFFDLTVFQIGRVYLQPRGYYPPFEPPDFGLVPRASFNLAPSNPSRSEEVHFDASNSYDPDGYIASYEWDLDGDGYTDTYGKHVWHRYYSTGTYHVKLTVRDEEGLSDSTTRTVSVSEENRYPVADFTYDPTNPTIGYRVEFSAGSSYDPDGYILSYEWDFDDDGITDAWGKDVSHIYYSQGIFQVRLTIRDNDGLTSTSTRSIRVERRYYYYQPTPMESRPPCTPRWQSVCRDRNVRISRVTPFGVFDGRGLFSFRLRLKSKS